MKFSRQSIATSQNLLKPTSTIPVISRGTIAQVLDKLRFDSRNNDLLAMQQVHSASCSADHGSRHKVTRSQTWQVPDICCTLPPKDLLDDIKRQIFWRERATNTITHYGFLEVLPTWSKNVPLQNEWSQTRKQTMAVVFRFRFANLFRSH